MLWKVTMVYVNMIRSNPVDILKREWEIFLMDFKWSPPSVQHKLVRKE